MLYILLVLFIVYIIGIYVWNNDGKDAPFVPTDADVVERIIKIADVSKDDVFYDLGSGDGRIVIAAAMKGATAFGIEKNKFKIWYSRLWIRILRLQDRAKIIEDDLFNTDLSTASVVCLYLLQSTNDKIFDKLNSELKEGTRVVSVAFEFKKWSPVKIDNRGVIYGPIRLYKIKKN